MADLISSAGRPMGRWRALLARLVGLEPGKRNTHNVEGVYPGHVPVRSHLTIATIIFFALSFTITAMALIQLLLGLGQPTPIPTPNFTPSSIQLPGTSAYVASYGFPTSAFSSYYFLPATPTQQPQPALYDPVLNITYPANLTNPDTIPSKNSDPVFYPSPTVSLDGPAATKYLDAVIASLTSLIELGDLDNCTICKSALALAKPAALSVPTLVPNAMINLCSQFELHSTDQCEEIFAATNLGAIATQVLAFADVEGLDGNYMCASIGNFCNAPQTSPLDVSTLFPKPKPENRVAPRASGKRVKVLHMSDFHIDPRYYVGAEADCSSYLCCRANNRIPTDGIQQPAPLYGAFRCDTPYDLGLAALQAVGPLTGTDAENPLGWAIYTGDLVSHDPKSELSRAYTEYAETSIYGMFKSYLTGPVFAALGNHDSNPEAIDAPYILPGPLGEQQSWNYEHVAGLWKHAGWINDEAAALARTHYGAYSIKNHFGLKIITFNTDFYYKSNIFNFINTTNPDNSGMFQFMIDELQAAEDAGERVWIIGHVLSGWDGSNPLPNPSNLFYQIVDRYSPHVIANIFFGHTHEDHFMIYYANNGTIQSADTALSTGWIGSFRLVVLRDAVVMPLKGQGGSETLYSWPSVTPLTNLNSGFRLYEVDTGDFNVYEAFTFYSDVSSYKTLSSTGPTYEFEYSTRDTYGPQANWPRDAPLNATFWHRVTEAMEKNNTLVSVQNTYQGKMSVKSPNCTSIACAKAKICYMRSGSVALGQSCPPGFRSTQSPFTGDNYA